MQSRIALTPGPGQSSSSLTDETVAQGLGRAGASRSHWGSQALSSIRMIDLFAQSWAEPPLRDFAGEVTAYPRAEKDRTTMAAPSSTRPR